MGDAGFNPAAPMAIQDERASLTSRIIPKMNLSADNNPLTAPLPPIPSTSASERAVARFKIDGNAVFRGAAGTLALAFARALLKHGLSALTLMDLQSTIDHSTSGISN